MIQFQAAVLHRVGEPLAIEPVEIQALKRGDVLIRLQASGLCHTDLEVITGSLAYPLPIILGHEGSGIVEAVGKDVRSVRVGDRVVCSWNPFCGRCFYCDQGQPILCESFTRHQPAGHLLDGTSRLSLAGRKLHHYSEVSSHAQYCVVPETGAVAVPPEMPPDRACLLGCAVMTGFGAVTRVAQVRIGCSVVVIGCGAVGLNVIQSARLLGAEPIIGVDLSASKLESARRFGTTHTLPGNPAEVLEGVRSLTAGRGADYVFEAAGSESSLQLALETARPGSKVIILGKTNVQAQVSLRFGSLMGEKQIIRSSYGGARPHQDFPLLSRLYLDGRLRLDDLITKKIKLQGINEGFADMREGRGLRTVIELS